MDLTTIVTSRVKSLRTFVLSLFLTLFITPLQAQTSENVDAYLNTTILLSSPSLGQRFISYKKEHNHAPSAELQKKWHEEIATEQSVIINALPSEAVVTAQTFRAVNAIKIVLPSTVDIESFINQNTHTNIEQVYETSSFELELAYSVPWIGASSIHSYGIEGKGMRIGILDSGVDYMHVNLGGTGFGYESNDPAVVEPGSFPNEVVVGGIDLVGDMYNPRSSNLEDRIPQRDGDPISFGIDHGTHVAAIAAGRPYQGVGGGVAPKADIYAIKVGSDKSGPVSSVAEEALDYVLDPNGDFDLSDRLDVINMSFGQAFGSVNTAWAQAIKTALDMGVIVVGSAGNSGAKPYISSSPASVDNVLSIAASVTGDLPYIPVEATLSTGQTIPTIATLPLTGDLITHTIEGETFEHFSRSCSIEEDIEDKIIVIRRNEPSCGTPAFAQYIYTKGAKALFQLYSNDHQLNGNIALGVESVPIVLSTLRLRRAPAFISIKGEALFFDQPAEKIASFSSQGPIHGVFKPSLSAAGVNILAAKAISGDAIVGKSGTSMAAPHVTGAMALIKSAHKNKNLDTLNAIVMNYANLLKDSNGNLYPLSRQGMGEIDIQAAINARAAAIPAGINLGLLSLDQSEIFTRTITVKNFSDTDQHMLIDVTNISALPGVKITYPKKIWVKAKDETKMTVKIHFNPFKMRTLFDVDFYEFGGLVSFTPSVIGDKFRVGLQAVVKPITNIEVNQLENTSISAENISPVPATISILPNMDISFFSDSHNLKIGAQAVTNDLKENVLRLVVATENSRLSPNEFNFSAIIYPISNQSIPRHRLDIGTERNVLTMTLTNLATQEILYSFPISGDFDTRIMALDVPLPDTLNMESAAISFNIFESRITKITQGFFITSLVPQDQKYPWFDIIEPFKTNNYTKAQSDDLLIFTHNTKPERQVINL